MKKLYSLYLKAGKVTTDTRKIIPGSVFFALRGPHFNANEFAAEALSKGASCAVVDDSRFALDDRYILVDDGLNALQELARHHRSQLEIPVIALTGSNGKTTSKELLNTVLSVRFRTLATSGNLNNHIGVPVTILGIDKSIELAVIEMGANHLGEIAALCAIANPTHGFITNIGKAHVGPFGGFENVVRGKSELFQHLIDRDGVVFINSADPILSNMAKRMKSPVFYPSKGDFYHCDVAGNDPFLQVRADNGEIVKTQLTGRYNFENVAVALCIGKYFEVDPQLANRAVENYAPSNMRSQLIRAGSNMVILDAYNANPSSMTAAVENLAELKAERKVLILGDMFELGDESDEAHRAVGRLLAERKFASVYLCGPMFRSALLEIPQARYFETRDQLMAELKRNPVRSSTVLVKASRGMGLEAVTGLLEN